MRAFRKLFWTFLVDVDCASELKSESDTQLATLFWSHKKAWLSAPPFYSTVAANQKIVRYKLLFWWSRSIGFCRESCVEISLFFQHPCCAAMAVAKVCLLVFAKVFIPSFHPFLPELVQSVFVEAPCCTVQLQCVDCLGD